MDKPELIIFDMDGLIFDSEHIAYRAWSEVLAKHNYSLSLTFYKNLIGSNEERIKTLCFENFGSDFPFAELKAERYKAVDRIIKEEGLPLKPGLKELLEYLSDKPLKKAVATSTSRQRADKLLNIHNLIPAFDYVLCGDEITKSKPDPEIFLTVTKKLHCDSSNTIVLEDSISGILAAYAGGMKPVMIPDMIEPTPEIKDLLFRCFPSLVEVKEFIKTYFYQG